MNKKLLAIAIGGVLAAPLAQAQTANVTLYGRINLDAEVIINAKQDAVVTVGGPAAGGKENLYRVTTNSSRFGMKGTESLGGGLNAIFQLESSVNPDASGGTLAGRETWVGLQGGWGTFKLGYFLSTYDDMHAIFGSVPTLLTGILATSALWSNTGYTGTPTSGTTSAANSVATGAFDDRIANSARYDTPNIAGFTGSLQIAGRDTGGSDNGDVAQQRRHAYVISTNGQYNNGPISIGLAYEAHNSLRDPTVVYTATSVAPIVNNKLQDQGVTLAASYNFGIIKVAAMTETLKYDISQGGDLKRTMWGLSGMGNLGPGQYYIGYFNAGDGRGGASCKTAAGITTCPRVGAVTMGPNTGSQEWEVSYTYPLSKRTLLYTGYVMIDNKANAGYNFNVGAVPGLCFGNSQNAAGQNTGCGDSARPQGFVAGMVHFF